jgi:ParB family chromosome partitioning protein
VSEEKASLLQPSSVDMVPPSKILPNPENPRMFFPEETLKILRESIRNVGILVPLTVYRSQKDQKIYLLDGQRRWMCATQLGLSKVPVNIVPEPTTFQNIVTMFNIHTLREPWELMPTALKLEVLIRMIQEQTGKKRVGVAHLSQITALSRPTVQRCLILLSLPKQYQDMILARDDQHIKTDFFIELNPVINKVEKVFPNLIKKYSRSAIIDKLIQKYRNKVITDIVDFRKVKKLINSIGKGVPKATVGKALEELISNPLASIEAVYPVSAQRVLELNSLKKMATSMIEQIKHFRPEDLKENKSFKKILEELHSVLTEALRQG